MKKLLSVFLAIALLGTFGLAGCKSTDVTSSADESLDDMSSEVPSADNTSSDDKSEDAQNEFDLAVDLTTVKRGINLSALEDPYKYSDFMFMEFTYTNIAEKGFDHIRMPIDFRNYADEKGNLDDEKMKGVDEAIRMANEAGLVVFLDFHGWYNFIALKDKGLFEKIWTNVAKRYKDYEHNDMLIFELINEPHINEGGDLGMANLVFVQCLTANAIREISPNRTICFATVEWNGPWSLEAGIENSYRDTPMMNYDNVIVALHCYSTIEFTHQNMAWNNTLGQFKKLDDTVLNDLRAQLKFLVDFTTETGMPVILNEFGFNTDPNTIPYEDQARYVETLVDILDEHDIAWTWWEYCIGEFAIYKRTGYSYSGEYAWNDAIVEAMMK